MDYALINLHETLNNAFLKAIKASYEGFEDYNQTVVTASKKFADYQCNASMEMSKLLKAKGNIRTLYYVLFFFI